MYYISRRPRANQGHGDDLGRVIEVPQDRDLANMHALDSLAKTMHAKTCGHPLLHALLSAAYNACTLRSEAQMNKRHPWPHHCGYEYNTMRRLYTRGPGGKGYTPMGWYCPKCREVRWDASRMF